MRVETKIFKPIGIKDGTLYIIDEAFSYDDGMKGVTMTKFDKMNDDILEERKDNYDDDSLKDFWMQAFASGNCEDSLSDYVEQIKDEDDGSLYYDSSYQGLDWYEQAVEKVQSVEGWEDTEFFDCVGGGRSWEKGMENPEYWDVSFVHEIPKEELALCVSYES